MKEEGLWNAHFCAALLSTPFVPRSSFPRPKWSNPESWTSVIRPQLVFPTYFLHTPSSHPPQLCPDLAFTFTWSWTLIFTLDLFYMLLPLSAARHSPIHCLNLLLFRAPSFELIPHCTDLFNLICLLHGSHTFHCAPSDLPGKHIHGTWSWHNEALSQAVRPWVYIFNEHYRKFFLFSNIRPLLHQNESFLVVGYLSALYSSDH